MKNLFVIENHFIYITPGRPALRRVDFYDPDRYRSIPVDKLLTGVEY